MISLYTMWNIIASYELILICAVLAHDGPVSEISIDHMPRSAESEILSVFTIDSAGRRKRVMESLLREGADPSSPNFEGESAFFNSITRNKKKRLSFF